MSILFTIILYYCIFVPFQTLAAHSNVGYQSINQSDFISGRSPLNNKQQRKCKHRKPDRTDTQENTSENKVK